MKAILIHAANRTIETVEVTDLKSIYAALGVDLITCAGYDESNKNCIYADDEGLLKDPRFFVYCPQFYPCPLAGNLLIIGTNNMGENVDTDFAPEKVDAVFLDAANPIDYMKLRNWE